MKLLIGSAMIFFGTLMAAGLIALGEPTRGHERLVLSEAPGIPAQLLQTARLWIEEATPILVRQFKPYAK